MIHSWGTANSVKGGKGGHTTLWCVLLLYLLWTHLSTASAAWLFAAGLPSGLHVHVGSSRIRK